MLECPLQAIQNNVKIWVSFHGEAQTEILNEGSQYENTVPVKNPTGVQVPVSCTQPAEGKSTVTNIVFSVCEH